MRRLSLCDHLPALPSLVVALLIASLPILSACGSRNIAGSNAVIIPPPQTQALNKPLCPTPNERALSASDVTQIITQAVTRAVALNLRATIAVTDREANVLAVFRMTGANPNTFISGGPLGGRPIPSELAAISKAGTCSFFGTTGNAFTPRTASFIIQEHFPPGVAFTRGGPLFGVQFSSLLFSDINPRLPLGLSADAGGVPLYIGDSPVGGIGVELDGVYSLDLDPTDNDQSPEELIAVAGSRGFEAPAGIRGNQILVDGVALRFVNAPPPTPEPLVNLATQGSFMVIPAFGTQATPKAGVPFLGPGSQFTCGTLGGRPVRIFTPHANIVPSAQLSVAEVERILSQAIQQAYVTRAGIRLPLNNFAEVNVAVVDADGNLLGLRATPDAPLFGVDVCVQKARSAAFMSNPNARAILNAAGMGNYVSRAAADGVQLNGSVAFSSRGLGDLHRPFFPDGIDCTGSNPCVPNAPGPFSTASRLFTTTNVWSPFNTGLQLDLIAGSLLDILANYVNPGSVPVIRRPPNNIRNGLQIFAGAVPLYKNGVLVGAIGISGDGIDQDDIIASFGSAGFESPANIRSDQLIVRGVRLAFVKFPANPNL
ncbi:MAG: heme-binding protein [Chloracidobacterium sp.]|nr:heme-binding protein [Chloracidobacterium sp.]MDW8218659.1 heme-binding protein [Acidobacteriota bacterium]